MAYSVGEAERRDGLMPVAANEAAAYGYEAENCHFVRAFLGSEAPRLTFDDGVDVVELLMAAYQSAEQERTLALPSEGRSCRPLRAGGGGGISRSLPPDPLNASEDDCSTSSRVQ
jgi:hypothetical protein